MSPNRQSVGRTPPPGLTIELARHEGIELHVHDSHQLALAARGVLTMSGVDRSWVLPHTRALWIPAGVRHSVAASEQTTMLSTYFAPANCPLKWDEPTVVNASGLLSELIAYLAQPHLHVAQRQRAEALIWDLMTPLPVTTLFTPMPNDTRARSVANALLDDVSNDRPLDAWGRNVGASGRTLARLFLAETGMGFERWRTTARLAAALPLLAAGMPVGTTARKVGYATASAFVAAFRREIGTTPAAYFRSG